MRAPYAPPACFHCRLAGALGQLQYATTTAPVLTARDTSALLDAAARGGRPQPDGYPLNFLGRIAQAPYMVVRSLLGQFVAMTPIGHEMNAAIREPTCRVHTAAALSGIEPTADWAHVLIHLHGNAPRLTLRHRSSGETEVRHIAERHAAFWVGDALDEATRGSGSSTGDELVLLCRAPMPWVSTQSPRFWHVDSN